jgi:hypothetical protein
MAVGIQISDANGLAYFSTDTQTWSFIGSFIAPANTNSSVSFSTLSFVSEVIFQRGAVDSVPDNQAGYIHSVSRSGTTVSYSGGTIRTLVIVLGR